MRKDRLKELLTPTEAVAASRLVHIAFIMDGNGRWAQSKGLPREAGHKVGAETFKRIVRYCKSIGIRYCTVYAFSTENINRPQHEVDAIFKLFIDYIKDAAEEKDIEFKFIGEPEKLSENIGKSIAVLEKETAGRPYRLNIAMNYGGRAEIVHAVNELLASGVDSVSEKDLNKAMYTHGCPDPDLVVRTGKEERISNFLLWQSAYSEFYFSDKMWPDFTSDDVNEAIYDFAARTRRWGNV